MLDEKIAAMKQIHRRKKREALERPFLTTEEAIERFKRGKILFSYGRLAVTYQHICEMQLRIPFLTGFYDSVYEDSVSFVYLNEKYQFTLMGRKREDAGHKTGKSMTEWKEQLFVAMAERYVIPEFMAEFQDEGRDYLIYNTSLPDGEFFNISYRVRGIGCTWEGSGQCVYERRHTLGVVLEAIVKELAI